MIDSVLAPYVCGLASLWPTPEVGTWRELDGTFAKIDLSGFTALTERIADRVDGGAEDLNAVIDGLFGHLIGAVLAAHGDVVQFGGDALTIWFDGDDHRHRALACVSELHRLVAAHGTVDAAGRSARLRMSAGVASGRLVAVLVGRSHHEVVLLGPLVSRVLQLENLAPAGTTAVDDPDAPGGHRLLRRHPVAPSTDQPPTDRSSASVHAVIHEPQRFIAPEIAAALTAEGGLAQHRTATVAFIGVNGFDEMVAAGRVEQAAAAITRVADVVDDAARDFGVCWTATDSTVDGVVFLLFGGAPIAHTDDAERVMRAVLQATSTADVGSVHTGIATGPVFAADVGHPRRRAYAVLGDTVNQAARLMGRAATSVALVDAATRASSRADFAAQHATTITVKGKRAPIQVSELGPAVGRRVIDPRFGPLVGRERECNAIRDAISDLSGRGRGRHLHLAGSNGSGRTRLLLEVRAQALAAGLQVAWVNGDEFSMTQPYAGATPIMALARERSTADLWSGHGDAQLQLTDAVEQAEARHVRVADVLAAHPTVVIVDDAASLDPSTFQLVSAVIRRVDDAPVVVATAAEGDPGWPPVTGRVDLELTPLDDAEIRSLVVAASPSFLLPEQVDAIVDTARGNPAIAEARAMGGSGGTLDAIVTAQLDRLSVDDLRALRQLSVCGLRPPAGLVQAVVAEPWRLHSDPVRRFVKGDGADLAVGGRLVRDLLYSALPKTERRRLHSRCANVLISLETSNAFECALHLYHAHRWDDAYEMSRVAARAAAGLGALAEAEAAWHQAISSCRAAGQTPLAGEVAELISIATERGALDSAEAALRAWPARLDASPDLLWAAAKLAEQRGQYATALRRARRLRREGGPLAARSLVLEALVHFRRGHMQAAASRLAEVLAAESVPPSVRAQAHLQSEMVLFELGDPAAEAHEALAEEAFLAAGNPVGAARSRLNRSGRLIEHGRLAEAVQLLDQCISEFERHGSLLDLVIATYNRGLAAIRQGRVDAAAADQRTGLRLAAGLGWSEGAGYHHLLAGQVAGFDDLDRSLAAFERAAAVFVALDADAWVLETDVRRAAVLLWHRHDSEAAALLQAVAGRANRPDDPALDLALERLLGWVALRQGAADEARTRFETAVARARELHFGYEVALSLWGLEHVAMTHCVEPEATWQAERTELFSAAGVTDGLRSLTA